MNDTYLATARLLCQVAPVVMADNVFALKGGTAINLFLRDMPRLSVDLDLVFPDHRPDRTEALATINESLRAAKVRLTHLGFDVDAVSARDMGETKLLVRREGILIKVEVNTVMRGVVNPTQTRSLSDAASRALQIQFRPAHPHHFATPLPKQQPKAHGVRGGPRPRIEASPQRPQFIVRQDTLGRVLLETLDHPRSGMRIHQRAVESDGEQARDDGLHAVHGGGHASRRQRVQEFVHVRASDVPQRHRPHAGSRYFSIFETSSFQVRLRPLAKAS